MTRSHREEPFAVTHLAESIELLRHVGMANLSKTTDVLPVDAAASQPS